MLGFEGSTGAQVRPKARAFVQRLASTARELPSPTSLSPVMAVGITLLTLIACPPAAAAEECVRVVGHEFAGENQSMDPADLQSGDDAYHVFAVYEPLVEVDSNWQPIPVLAESWEHNADATQWTFHLRQGVKFHDGSDFDAADVVYTFRRLLDPEVKSAARAVLSAFMEPAGIEALDERTVRFNLTRPVAEFPVLSREKFVQIVPEGAKTEQLRLNGIGTGPFVQEQFAPGGAVRILRRNADYWQPGLPKAECLRITVIEEPVTRAAALMSGEADLVPKVDPVTLTTLEDNPNVELISSGPASALTIAMQVDVPPFDDVRVRQAMKLVIDRQAMVDTVLLGFGALGNDTPVPLDSPVALSQEAPKRDVNKAKELLAEAGYPDGIAVDLYTSEIYPGMMLLTQVYADMAAEAGIKINVIQTPAESYWDDIWMKRSLMVDWWAARAPLLALSIAYRTDAQWNETNWKRPDYDEMLDNANAKIDADERNEALQKIQTLLANEGGAIIPVHAFIVAALRKGCTGYEPHVNGNLIDYRNLECK